MPRYYSVDASPSSRQRNPPGRAIRCWLALLGLLVASTVSGQLRGPDVEGAFGLVTSANEGAGSGPTASLIVHHAYPLTRRLYVRVGLGATYHNFVSTDAEPLGSVTDARLLRRRLDLREAHGVAALNLGMEFGKWSLETGVAYLRLLWADAMLTTATYGGEGQEIVAPITADLRYRAATPGPGMGEYYLTRHTNWVGSLGLRRCLTPDLAVGLRYSHHLARPTLVHSNEFICDEPLGCAAEPTFSRQLTFPPGSLTILLRYRLSSR